MSIPKRHGIHLHQTRNIAAPLLFGIRNRAAAEPDPAQWQKLGEFLNVGDPLVDTLIEWLHSQGQRPGWVLMEEAMFRKPEQGYRDLPVALCALFETITQAPPWLDRDRLARGLDVSARSGMTGMRALRDLGLMAGYQASAINQTLVRTGALKKGAAKRVAETTKWWFDCTEPGGLEPGGQGFQTTLRVRIVHALIRKQLSQRKDWDHTYLGLPVNQVDMQATYLAFSVLFIIGQRMLGTPLKSSEAEDVMHLWQYIGWLMGVHEELLVTSEQDGRIALYQNLLSQATADETSAELGRALMDEPLSRHYGSLKWFRGRWEKQVHLSILRLFVGRRGMKALGLPLHILPWYPLLFAPINYLIQSTIRLLPGGKHWLTRRGRKAQRQLLQVLFGDEHPDIIRTASPPHSIAQENKS